jgi:hypothetical protein
MSASLSQKMEGGLFHWESPSFPPKEVEIPPNQDKRARVHLLVRGGVREREREGELALSISLSLPLGTSKFSPSLFPLSLPLGATP